MLNVARKKGLVKIYGYMLMATNGETCFLYQMV